MKERCRSATVLFAYLKEGDIVVVQHFLIVLWMRNNTLNLHFLAVVSVREAAGYAELNGPVVDVMQGMTGK